MGEPVRQVFIDQWIESYDNYVPDEWGPAFFKDVKPGSMLDQVLLDLMMAWRTTAYIASMPATFIKAIQVSTLAYARYKSSDSSLVSFGEKVLVELSAKIPELVDDRQLRSQLMAELVTLAEDFRQRGEKASAAVDMPIQSLWGDFLKQDAFYMTIWASQRVAYVAFYNAYEAFLVLCAKQALSVDKLRN